MGESKFPGVKGLSGHTQQGKIIRRNGFFPDLQENSFIPAVKFISDQGESQRKESRSDLMLAAGMEYGFDQSAVVFTVFFRK